MQLEIPYAGRIIPVDIPETLQVTELAKPRQPVVQSIGEELDALLKADAKPDSLKSTLERLQPESVAITIPAPSSRVPVNDILPVLLDNIMNTLPHLERSSVHIIMGRGLPQQDENQAERPGDFRTDGYNVLCCDTAHSPVVELPSANGQTALRVPASLVNADLKISVGQVQPHRTLGFSDASTDAAISCMPQDTLEDLFGFCDEEQSLKDNIHQTPALQALVDAARFIGFNFTVNVVLDRGDRVVRVLTGAPERAFKKGIQACSDLYGVPVSEAFDIVIACCHELSAPHHSYELEKGLNLASRIINKGGKALFLTASRQEIGEDIFFDHVCQDVDPDKIRTRLNTLKRQLKPWNVYLLGKMNADYGAEHFCTFNSNQIIPCHLRAADISNVIREWAGNGRTTLRLAYIPSTRIYFEKPDLQTLNTNPNTKPSKVTV